MENKGIYAGESAFPIRGWYNLTVKENSARKDRPATSAELARAAENNVNSRLKTKLQSERGASLSVALLLFLVCSALCAVIIAAATASSGQFAELGKSDQRYYSVVSASRVFSDSLDGGYPTDARSSGDGTLTFVFEQKKQGSRTSTNGGGWSNVTPDNSKTSVSFKSPTRSAAFKAFDFLPSITHYAIYGPTNTTDALQVTSLNAKSWDEWIDVQVANSPASVFSYTVTPSFDVDGLDNADVTVEVTGRLNSDWTLELDFHNKTSNASNQYHLYMVLSADVTMEENQADEVGATTVSESAVTNTSTITKTYTTTVVWRIERVVPGRGLAGAST